MHQPSTKLFSIYRSSAGSGKTRTLAKEYLKLALRYRATYFKHILAVTFTNKSTQEMKQRILRYLHEFASGIPNDLADELKKELHLDDNTLQQYSQEVQREILHNYSHFSINTIDAFFQKVIRSFTREAGIMGDYTLEMDQDKVIDEVIDQLIDELGSNEVLSKWIIQFTEENLEEARPWDVRHSLKDFTRHIFKEEFKLIEQELIEKTSVKDYFQNLLRELQKERSVFMNTITKLGSDGIEVIHKNGFSANSFKWGTGTAYHFLEKVSSIKTVAALSDLGKRVEGGAFQDADNWPKKGTEREEILFRLAENQLIPLLNDILDYRNKNLERCLSAELVLKHFYAFGLISDISRKLAAYKQQNNLMLIADAPALLSGLIQDSETPFIYEKVGSFYRNFLIDEFQDTSVMQWQNFHPLVKNSLDQGYTGMVVGDVKQAIYRWRGGDLKLLQEGLQKQFGKEQVETINLQTNYRSSAELVNFNNLFFQSAAGIIKQITATSFAEEAFADVKQAVYHKDRPGFVQIRFFVQENRRKIYNAEDESEGSDHWKLQALQYMLQQIEALQLAGVPAKDIAILVRKGEDGKQVAAHLLKHKVSAEARNDCNYEVISNESLLLGGAASIKLLTAAMRMLWRWNDPIARAGLGFEYQRLFINDEEATALMLKNQADFEAHLPADFVKGAGTLRKMPLYEMAENLIQIFSLHTIPGELPYQFTFMDLLLDFSKRERNDLHSFLQWWEENKESKSIQLSDEVEAMRIITIHKAKGLQFRYVLIPFCDWSLDHENLRGPLLWVKSDEGLFKDKGYLPVQYASSMTHSYFKNDYEEERIRTYLDNLNLLYVALTRAEDGMIVISPVDSKLEVKDEPKRVAGLLFKVIAEQEEWQSNWKSDELCLQLGELKVAESNAKAAQNGIQISRFAMGKWNEKMLIRQTAKNFYDPVLKSKLDRVQYGIKVHEVLARIIYREDLQKAIAEVLSEGFITQEEAHTIKQQLEKMFLSEQVADWFDKKWEVKNEANILLPGMQELRVDRLLIHDKQATIIDYKTGEKKAEDIKQVKAYMDTLRSMGYMVKGFLLYLGADEMSIEEVKLVALKGDKDQLSLGL